MSDILKREPWPFDWHPPVKANQTPYALEVQFTAFVAQLAQAMVALKKLAEEIAQSAVEPCDDPECVSSGRAVLCDIHGEEYDRAHR